MSHKVVEKTYRQKTRVCDRCGAYENNGKDPFTRGALQGTMIECAQGYDGSWGGQTVDIDLCENCTTAFRAFLLKKKKEV